ncbi:MAG: hypothetical protein LBB89_05940 [Treponema sp.]|jgi:hypothetical protein|nr:hypothetical protein [Treponema sp.]
MLWPGIKKLGKELNLKRTDSEVVGFIKNCFVKMYDGRNMKIMELYVPEMDDDDKNYIIKKLESRKIKRYEWCPNGVKVIFTEIFAPYSMKKIKELLDELINYFSNKYPAQKPQCQHCGQHNETDIYCINDASLLICNDCHNKIKKTTHNENLEQQNIKGNYLWGFIGAILFAIPGILLTVLFFVFLESMAAVSAVIYIILGTIGYKKFKGKISPVGAVIIIIAGLIMVAAGITISYSVVILREISKELEIINFDMFMDAVKIISKAILEMPEMQKELLKNIILSYIVSGFYFVYQLNKMVKEWKNQKSVDKPREIV